MRHYAPHVNSTCTASSPRSLPRCPQHTPENVPAVVQYGSPSCQPLLRTIVQASNIQRQSFHLPEAQSACYVARYSQVLIDMFRKIKISLGCNSASCWTRARAGLVASTLARTRKNWGRVNHNKCQERPTSLGCS